MMSFFFFINITFEHYTGFASYLTSEQCIFCLFITVTVIEVLPKEKKQKEEKTVLLGQCSVDLLPMIKGKFL